MNTACCVNDKDRNICVRCGEDVLGIAGEQRSIKTYREADASCGWATQLLNQTVVASATADSCVCGSEGGADEFECCNGNSPDHAPNDLTMCI